MAAKVAPLRPKSKPPKSLPRHALQFLVVLAKTKPLVWRRIQVPSDYSFWDLHVAIQDAMGWQDSHLHEFRLIDPRQCGVQLVGIPDEDFPFERPCLAGWEVRISHYYRWETLRDAAPATYLYDFGDDWQHFILFEDVVLAGAGRRPRCLAGERACPPEDCGGVHGFESLLEILANPAHPDHAEIAQWCGAGFERDAFDPKKVRFDDPKKRWQRAFRR